MLRLVNMDNRVLATKRLKQRFSPGSYHGLYGTAFNSQNKVAFNNSTEQTVAFWLKFSLITGVGYNVYVEANSAGPVQPAMGWNVYQQGLTLNVSRTDGTTTTANLTIAQTANILNKWVYVTCTFSRALGLATYINANLIKSTSTPGTNVLANSVFYAAARSNEPRNYQITDIKLWNRLLSTTEIASLYYDDAVIRQDLLVDWPIVPDGSLLVKGANNTTMFLWAADLIT